MNTSDDSERLLTVEETANLLGLTKSTLDQWRSRGINELPYTRCGARIRYSLGAVREYLRRRTVSSQEEGTPTN